MSERDRVLDDLRERARFYASLTTLGIPRERPRSPLEEPPGVAAIDLAAAGASDAGPSSVRGRARQAGLFGELPDELPAPRASPATVSATGGVAMPDEFAVPPDAAAGERLAAVRSWLGDCHRCKLAGGRKTIVFGQGSPQAALMFIGEAPGADEDEQGLAFVGRAGQLLTDIIEKGLRFKRSEVFIANVIKCRPPQNRNPEPEEILACQPFLAAQIEAIRPKVLVGLGKFGAQWLLKTAEPISRLRGRLGSYQGIHVMPTYHPAYLLRNPGAKKDVWEDMKVVLQLLAE